MGEAARGYSWPQFPPGHTLTLRHGAKSPRRVDPLAAELVARVLELLAGLVLEDGRRWGEVAAPWQWEDARAVLDPGGAPFHYLTRPRGGSKTSDLAGVVLAAMVEQLPQASRGYGAAADRDQGRL